MKPYCLFVLAEPASFTPCPGSCGVHFLFLKSVNFSPPASWKPLLHEDGSSALFWWPTPSSSVGPRPRCFFWARTLISLLRSGSPPTNAAVPALKCPTGTPDSPGYAPYLAVPLPHRLHSCWRVSQVGCWAPSRGGLLDMATQGMVALSASHMVSAGPPLVQTKVPGMSSVTPQI